MMLVLSAEQFYKADALTVENQKISSTDLMERAGEQVFNWLLPQLNDTAIVIHIFCGVGNNGGDGLVVARLLLQKGFNVNTYIVNYKDNRSPDFLKNYDRVKNATSKWPLIINSKEDFPQIDASDFIIDAIFGIGLNRSPKGWVKALIQHLNQSPAYKLSIDIPSGLYADTPVDDFEAVLQANFTLTFTAPKLSFFLPQTGVFIPYYRVLNIGLEIDFLTQQKPLAVLYSRLQAREMLSGRPKFSHKGDFGHTYIIGGSYGKIGAVVLATRAALKSGSGLVTAFTPRCGYSILQTAVPEVMVQTDVADDFISKIELDGTPDSIGIGMGMGIDKKTITAFKTFLSKSKKPIVIDADGINIISKNKTLLKLLPEETIFTPHAGELKRLIGDWEDDYEKLKKAKEFVTEHNVILVIKGAHSIIVTPDMNFINTSGNPGMATAGSGDVLTGILSGLLAQGYFGLEAALLGVYLHGVAGDFAYDVTGSNALTASDIVDNIGESFKYIIENIQQQEEESNNNG